MSVQTAMAAVRQNPKSSKAWSDLGDALLEAGQRQKAQESYQRALQLDPLNAAAQAGIANALQTGTSTASTPPAPAATMLDSMPATPPRQGRAQVVQEDMVEEPTPGPAAAKEKPARPPATRREPPPWPKKPTRNRMMAGIIGALLLPLLCVCGLMWAFINLFSGT